MDEERNFYQVVEEICAADSRYKSDAYEFVMQALHFTQNKLKRKGHITGKELSGGIREFVIEQYGPMAKTVLRHWGITKTQDFGNIVFNLLDKKVLFKTETDSIDDFKDVYDFESVFGDVVWDKIIKEIK
jgi:uncharacterized repeat protein (TIGR04138 family)